MNTVTKVFLKRIQRLNSKQGGELAYHAHVFYTWYTWLKAVDLSVGLLALERNILLMHPPSPLSLCQKESLLISQRALLLKHAAALRMTSWHLRIFGWEESGKSPGNEKGTHERKVSFMRVSKS